MRDHILCPTGVTFSPLATGFLHVRDTVVRNTNFGLVVGTTDNGIANVSLERSEVSLSQAGMGFFGLGVAAVLHDCVVDGDTTGFLTSSASVDVNGCTISHNGLAISNDGTATVRVANTVIVHNVTGLSGTGTLTRISGDPANPVKTNRLSGNTADGAFSGTFTAQ